MSGRDHRSCGDCVACCVYLRIEDAPKMRKGGLERCRYLTVIVVEPNAADEEKRRYTGASCKGNCTVYTDQEKKPDVCNTYECAWMQGYGWEEHRPDKILMLFDTTKHVENALEAKPLAEGQELTQIGKDAIDAFSQSTNKCVVVLNFKERRVRRIAGRCV